MSKIKIINDPVYGFVRIPGDIIFRLIEHPYFQRLRRIKQLGLTHLVYPGALHTRFQHAIGAQHLMRLALDNLRSKGIKITDEECDAASIAIILHDIGHAPFSHALEHSLIEGVHHEVLSLLFMEKFNEEFDGRLSLAIEIFKGTYHKKFLHQLVSSQLDVDRLDYLKRDSFYTGVYEGFIGSDRIIMMMNVENDELVVEAKGIYSIEKFLLARRFMYWQVYLHKTVVSAEQLLVKIMKRAKELANEGKELFATPSLHYFLYNKIKRSDLQPNSKVLDTFALLDDYDIQASIKAWMQHPDSILSTLCKKMICRDLFKIEFHKEPIDPVRVQFLQQEAAKAYAVPQDLAHYYVFTDEVENNAYSAESIKINILMKDKTVMDIAEASDQYDLSTLSKRVRKYFICYPKNLVTK